MPYGQQPNSFQQPGLHQQPNSFQQPGPYQQAPPNRPPGLPHGMSFGGYGQQAGPPPVHGLNAFDGLGRQRSHSDANGAGQFCSHMSTNDRLHVLVQLPAVCDTRLILLGLLVLLSCMQSIPASPTTIQI